MTGAHEALTETDRRFLAMLLRRHYFPTQAEQRYALDLLARLEAPCRSVGGASST